MNYKPFRDNGSLTGSGKKFKGPIYDQLIDEMLNRKLYFSDKRHKGGCLWIFGDYSLKPVISLIEKQYKVKFYYSEKGSRTTDGLSAWWTEQIIPMKTGQEPQYISNSNLKQITDKAENSAPIREAGKQTLYTVNKRISITDDKKSEHVGKAVMGEGIEIRKKKFIKWLEHKYSVTEVTEKIYAIYLLRLYLKEKKQLEFYQIQLCTEISQLKKELEMDKAFEMRHSRNNVNLIFSVMEDYTKFMQQV